MSTAEDIMARALQLPEQERAELAHRLLLSLEPDDLDPHAGTLWAAEIEARLRAFEEGQTDAIPGSEALEQIRQTLRRVRPS
jgi:putative addiction module component (TIGR02574 family)